MQLRIKHGSHQHITRILTELEPASAQSGSGGPGCLWMSSNHSPTPVNLCHTQSSRWVRYFASNIKVRLIRKMCRFPLCLIILSFQSPSPRLWGQKTRCSFPQLKLKLPTMLAQHQEQCKVYICEDDHIDNHMRWPTKKNKNNDDKITMNFVQGV